MKKEHHHEHMRKAKENMKLAEHHSKEAHKHMAKVKMTSMKDDAEGQKSMKKEVKKGSSRGLHKAVA